MQVEVVIIIKDGKIMEKSFFWFNFCYYDKFFFICYKLKV